MPTTPPGGIVGGAFRAIGFTMAEAPESNEPGRDSVSRGGDGGEALIVEADPVMSRILDEALRSLGWNVALTSTVEAASVRLQSQSFGLAIVNRFIGAYSGIDFCVGLRKRCKDAVIVMVTETDDLEKALSAGIDDYWRKPLALERVRERARIATQAVAERLHRVNTERALRQSRDRYTLALAGANDGIWDWNVTERHFHASPRWYAQLGITHLECRSLDEWFARVHPDDARDFDTAWQDHLRGVSTLFEVEHRIRFSDGSYRWVLTRGLAIREGGRAVRIAGSQTDVTQRVAKDLLTGLPNREYFMESLRSALAESDASTSCALLHIRLDNLAAAASALGEKFSSTILRECAHRLSRAIELRDVVARTGEAEFSVLLRRSSWSTRDVEAFARTLQETLGEPFEIHGQEFFATPRIGMVGPSYERDAAQMFRDATTALLSATLSGTKGRAFFRPSIRNTAISRITLESDLRRALEREELSLMYQPIYDIGPRTITGFEVLLRWHHPTRGTIAPSIFVPVAEEAGFIGPIGSWVLERACAELASWNAPDVYVSVNVAAEQFLNRALVSEVSNTLARNGIQAKQLKLEVTETTLVHDLKAASEAFHEFSEMGVGRSLDDFGTGYSAMSYLVALPLTTLKVDRAFVAGFHNDPKRQAVVRSVITLAHGLELDVVAEGVEEEAELSVLDTLGCDCAQGFLLARPLAPDAARALLTEKSS
jgi:diguanylate cyclase (GGDEF)-like protein/PAS domain S-box-containing protein